MCYFLYHHHYYHHHGPDHHHCQEQEPGVGTLKSFHSDGNGTDYLQLLGGGKPATMGNAANAGNTDNCQ